MSGKRACILLAAGHSERFGGGDKLLADLAGAPVALHAARTARQFKFDSYIAVCPSPDCARARVLGGAGFQITAPEGDDIGAGYSLSAGVRAALSNDAETIFVMLADMPFVKVETLARLANALAGKPAAFCRHGERPGPPAAFTRRAAMRLTALEGDEGAASVFRGGGEEAFALVAADAAELFDIDCADDLERARRRRSGGRA